MTYKSIEQNTAYNNFVMNNFSLFLLMALLVCSSFENGHIQFGVVGPFTTSAFKCLQTSLPTSTKSVIIRAFQNSKSPAGIDPNAIQTISNALAAKSWVSIYVEICRGINATSQIQLVNTEIINPVPALYGSTGNFFIKVEPTHNPDCSWEGYSPLDNCNFLKEAIRAMPRNWQHVVFSTARIWQQFFGNSCDTFAEDTGAQLSYANYDKTGHVNQTQSFADFVPFGGWTATSYLLYLKQVGGNATVPLLCGVKDWHAFVEEYWASY